MCNVTVSDGCVVAGVYGDKVTSLTRFAAGFRRLSPACQQRLTVEVCRVAMRVIGSGQAACLGTRVHAWFMGVVRVKCLSLP